MSPIFTYAAELYREMREEFELTVEAAHAAAEEGTRGSMLNKHGRAEGIDAYSLMTGPWSRVERYGSPELIEWCQEYGRPSVARFEREWFTSWLGEMPEPDALQDQLDGIRAVYTPERMAIDRALAAAEPPRMMNRREANETLNKVVEILRGVARPSAIGYPAIGFENLHLLPPNTEVQLKLDIPSYWGTNESWPGLALGRIVGVETTDMQRPVYQVQLDVARGRDGIVNVMPESFVVVS